MDRSTSQASINARTNWKKVFAARKFLSLAKIQSMRAPANLMIGGHYRVGKKIANGAFGQLRLGKDIRNGTNVAIKLEAQNSRIPMLFLEFRFYKVLSVQKHKAIGLPDVYYYGPCGKYNALVMELLGPNLEELFVACQRRFSLKTVLLLAIQLLERIEYVHCNGIIYRDIKPENCLIGRPRHGRTDLVYLVDFGLAKEYLDVETGKHIPYTENKSLTGTVRYMSINSHQGKEQSRRDDLEALGHVFFYFLSGGRLPWQGIKCEDIRKRYQIIGNIKEETRVSDLGQKYPWEFSLYLRYCRALKFTQAPDYLYLKNLFRSCLNRIGSPEDNVFDWMIQLNENDSDEDNNTVQIFRQEKDKDSKDFLDQQYATGERRSRSNESIIMSREPESKIVANRENSINKSKLTPKKSMPTSSPNKTKHLHPLVIVSQHSDPPKPKPLAAIEPMRRTSFLRRRQSLIPFAKQSNVSGDNPNGSSDLEEGQMRKKRAPANEQVEFVRFDSCCSLLRVVKKFGLNEP